MKYSKATSERRIDELKRLRAQKLREVERTQALAITNIDVMGGAQFEHYIGELLTYQGFAVTVTKASGDLGVDILAAKDGIKWAIQVKRQDKPISRRAVSDAVTGKIHYNCDEAMVVTNGSFSKGAKELAGTTGCKLVDRDTLIEWIVAFKSPGIVTTSPEILRLDEQIGDELRNLAGLEGKPE